MKKIFTISFVFLASFAYAETDKMPDPNKEGLSSALNGFYITGNVGGATQQSSESDFSGEGIESRLWAGDLHLNSRNALNFTGNIGIGWMFTSYAALEAVYQAVKSPVMQYSNLTTTSDSVNNPLHTQTGFGNIKSQMALFNGYLFLSSIFGVHQTRVVPYIGGGVGYAHNHLSQTRADENFLFSGYNLFRSNNEGKFAYQILAGWYYILHKHVLMNFKFSYLDMGSIKAPLGSFRHFDHTGEEIREALLKAPKSSLKSGTFTVGFTVVI